MSHGVKSVLSTIVTNVPELEVSAASVAELHFGVLVASDLVGLEDLVEIIPV